MTTTDHDFFTQIINGGKDLKKGINLLITTGTTNEIVYAQSKIFQGKNSRSNHSFI